MLEFLEKIPNEFIGFFIFFSSFIENIFPPYPGDTVTVFGGALAGAQKISLLNVGLNVFLGSLMSALLMYYFGEIYLKKISNYSKWKWVQELTSTKSLEKTSLWFKKYGFFTVLFSRFSAGIRFFITIVAGMSKMNILLFIIAFAISTCIWNFILIYAGYSLAENFEKVLDYIKTYNTIIIVMLVLIGTGIFLYKKYKRNQVIEK